MEFIKKMYDKYKMQVRYLIFGVATTIISIASYYLLFEVLTLPNVPSTIASWFLSVVFAYITNKIWVFESKSCKFLVIVKEALAFFSARIFTGALETFLMWLAVDVLDFPGMIVKIIVNVIVIILNYILSKVLVFKKKTPTAV